MSEQQEMYFDLISVEELESLLGQLGYANLEYNGEEENEFSTTEIYRYIHYVGELDTTYEVRVEVKENGNLLSVYDRDLDEKHYVPHAKIQKTTEGWKITHV